MSWRGTAFKFCFLKTPHYSVSLLTATVAEMSALEALTYENEEQASASRSILYVAVHSGI